MVNDILDISRIEAGRLTLEEEPFDLPSSLDALMAMLAVRANQKSLKLDWSIDERVPRMVVGDAARLRQCLVSEGVKSEGVSE